MNTIKLKEYAARMERLLDEQKTVRDEMADLKKEMKSDGIDVKAMERVLKVRMNDSGKDESDHINNICLYAGALGMGLDVIPGDGVADRESGAEPIIVTFDLNEISAGDPEIVEKILDRAVSKESTQLKGKNSSLKNEQLVAT